MSIFTDAERTYLGERRLARIATVGPDGTPHVCPVGMYSLDASTDAIDVSGHDFADTKKFRDVARTGRAALVVDDLASTDSWRPRGIEVRGRAEAVHEPEPHIRLHPERVIGWGLEDPATRNARSVRT